MSSSTSGFGQDEQHSQGAKVDDLTKKFVDEIDSTLSTKEAEIMQV
jgi:ribosome recycling factor